MYRRSNKAQGIKISRELMAKDQSTKECTNYFLKAQKK
jgi:hypothetical protein